MGTSLEKRAVSFCWYMQMHDTDGAAAELTAIYNQLRGLLERYETPRLTHTQLVRILKDACFIYAGGLRRISFADTLIETIQDITDGHEKDLADIARRAEALSAAAFTGNGVGSFRRRNFVGRPEDIAISRTGDTTLSAYPSEDDGLEDDADDFLEDDAEDENERAIRILAGALADAVRERQGQQ